MRWQTEEWGVYSRSASAEAASSPVGGRDTSPGETAGQEDVGSNPRPTGEPASDGVVDGSPGSLTRRSVLKSAAATTTAAAMTATASNTAAAGEGSLTGIRGANYIPTDAVNMYQVWANYEKGAVERDLDYAADLGLNSVRVWASYYYWREDGPSFFRRVEHFLSECEKRGIRPILVLFESLGNEPTRENRTAKSGYATHSPSREEIISWRNWDGWARSPRHFARRWAKKFATDGRLLATEIMNEPGKSEGAPKRVEFANEMLGEVVRESPGDPTLTMGTKTPDLARQYDGKNFDGHLDFHQFHHNLPVDENHIRSTLEKAQAHRSKAGKPVFCTEWQRTRREPPNRYQPNLASLAATMRAAHDEFDLDGDYFWQLMLKRAYLEPPRKQGRYNGLFRKDGIPFDTSDYHALKGGDKCLPESWYDDQHPYPEPHH